MQIQNQNKPVGSETQSETHLCIVTHVLPLARLDALLVRAARLDRLLELGHDAGDLAEAGVRDSPTDGADVDEGVEDEGDGEDGEKVDEHVVTLLPALHGHHGGAAQQLDVAENRGVGGLEADDQVEADEDESEEDLDNILEHEEQVIEVRTTQSSAYFLSLSVPEDLLSGEVS